MNTLLFYSSVNNFAIFYSNNCLNKLSSYIIKHSFNLSQYLIFESWVIYIYNKVASLSFPVLNHIKYSILSAPVGVFSSYGVLSIR